MTLFLLNTVSLARALLLRRLVAIRLLHLACFAIGGRHKLLFRGMTRTLLLAGLLRHLPGDLGQARLRRGLAGGRRLILGLVRSRGRRFFSRLASGGLGVTSALGRARLVRLARLVVLLLVVRLLFIQGRLLFLLAVLLLLLPLAALAAARSRRGLDRVSGFLSPCVRRAYGRSSRVLGFARSVLQVAAFARFRPRLDGTRRIATPALAPVRRGPRRGLGFGNRIRRIPGLVVVLVGARVITLRRPRSGSGSGLAGRCGLVPLRGSLGRCRGALLRSARGWSLLS
mmetsp:Transcript_42704/g.114310  ORF Transcript_42704/g.114310 Transcript_42704/m.114310 type:complete len:285 (+) Transcript_42704:379-1233(+)